MCLHDTLVSGPVIEVEVQIISNANATVSWKQPEYPNGKIDHYRVIATSLTNNTENVYDSELNSEINLAEFFELSKCYIRCCTNNCVLFRVTCSI